MRGYVLITQQNLQKFEFLRYTAEKFKFLQILLGDKNATYLCSKVISTLHLLFPQTKEPFILLNLKICQTLRHFQFLSKFQLPKIKFSSSGKYKVEIFEEMTNASVLTFSAPPDLKNFLRSYRSIHPTTL